MDAAADCVVLYSARRYAAGQAKKLGIRGERMGKSKKTVTGRVLHDPVKDKLRPIFPPDLSRCRTIDGLVRAMGNTAFTGRQTGDAADLLEASARDEDCFVVMTLSGALPVRKMGLMLC